MDQVLRLTRLFLLDSEAFWGNITLIDIQRDFEKLYKIQKTFTLIKSFTIVLFNDILTSY